MSKHKSHTHKPELDTESEIKNSLDDTDIQGDEQTQSVENDDLMDNIDIEANTISALKQQLVELKAKADRNFDLAARAKAELDNVRKRTEQEVSNAYKYALERFVPELFPLLDGLDQGLNTLPNGDDYIGVRDGLDLTIKMFKDILVKFGVEVLNPVNEAFNPAQHEAIAMQPNSEVPNNTVLTVVQKGYMLNNRVLRPARVVVSSSAT